MKNVRTHIQNPYMEMVQRQIRQGYAKTQGEKNLAMLQALEIMSAQLFYAEFNIERLHYYLELAGRSPASDYDELRFSDLYPDKDVRTYRTAFGVSLGGLHFVKDPQMSKPECLVSYDGTTDVESQKNNVRMIAQRLYRHLSEVFGDGDDFGLLEETPPDNITAEDLDLIGDVMKHAKGHALGGFMMSTNLH